MKAQAMGKKYIKPVIEVLALYHEGDMMDNVLIKDSGSFSSEDNMPTRGLEFPDDGNANYWSDAESYDGE